MSFLENRIPFDRDIRLLNISAYAHFTGCDEIISAYAQPAFKSFPRMLRVRFPRKLSMDVHVKTVKHFTAG